jgi:signal transduction histidine kinase
LHGVLIGLVSAVGFELIDLPNGLPDLNELTRAFVPVAGAGWVGGSLGEAILRWQRALYHASQAISAARSPQDIVEAIGEHLAGSQVSQVALWQDVSEVEEGASEEIELLNAWTSRIARGWPPGQRLSSAQVPALGSFWRQAPQVLRTRKLDASERAVWEHRSIRSAILLPLSTSSDTRIGLLMVGSRRTYGFFRGTVRRYLTIGAQAALALENLRLLEESRHTATLRERQRLAHEIHDTLAQGFSGIVMKLEAAEEMLPPDTPALQEYLDHARHTARDSLAEARRLMWALRPEALERASLPEALATLTERWSEDCAAAVSINVAGTTYSLAPEIEVALFRITQEALTNCRKYAHASKVSLTLSYLDDLVALDIQDDGVGFDPAQPSTGTSDHSGGFGLNGMRKRVERLGGTLLVESMPGQGTTVAVELPIAGE